MGEKMKRLYYLCLSLLILAMLGGIYPSLMYAESYTYDSAGRLTKVIYDDGSTTTYSYDNSSNLLKRALTVEVSLADVIVALQLMAAIEPSGMLSQEADVNRDGKVGLEEALYVLQKVSALRD